jgi:uncharacterized SAM-binding protein YcdF (DUF218 family)
MKLIFGIVAIVLAAIIVALGSYLAPNDLAACGTRPSLTSGCQKADAIVAISGGDTMARTSEAIMLYQNGWSDKLVFSGAAQDKSGPSNAEAMRRQAEAAGVPAKAILTEGFSATTKENAINTQGVLRQHGISSVILVTSAYHQRRAGLEFENQAGQELAMRNHPVMSDNQWAGGWWWATPTGWYLAVSECVKIIAFYLGGTR